MNKIVLPKLGLACLICACTAPSACPSSVTGGNPNQWRIGVLVVVRIGTHLINRSSLIIWIVLEVSLFVDSRPADQIIVSSWLVIDEISGSRTVPFLSLGWFRMSHRPLLSANIRTGLRYLSYLSFYRPIYASKTNIKSTRPSILPRILSEHLPTPYLVFPA